MPNVTEIAPDVYRISTFVSEIKLEFNHFLVNDEAPLLFHAGLRHLFPELLESVARIIDPARMRYIAFSHFESDECGGLNRWLERSEEHTSELQSPKDLVCRLLLEKKKKNQ